METKDIIAVLFLVVLFSSLWVLLKSDTMIGRWMRSQARGERRLHRSMLSGYAIPPKAPAPQRGTGERQ